MAPSFASLCNYNAMTYITIHVTSGAACIGEMGQPLALDEDLVQFFTRILRHFPLFRFYSSFFVLHHVMAMKVFPRDAMHSYVLSIVCFDRWTKTSFWNGRRSQWPQRSSADGDRLAESV